jgi:hypothetical protein
VSQPTLDCWQTGRAHPIPRVLLSLVKHYPLPLPAGCHSTPRVETLDDEQMSWLWRMALDTAASLLPESLLATPDDVEAQRSADTHELRMRTALAHGARPEQGGVYEESYSSVLRGPCKHFAQMLIDWHNAGAMLTAPILYQPRMPGVEIARVLCADTFIVRHDFHAYFLERYIRIIERYDQRVAHLKESAESQDAGPETAQISFDTVYAPWPESIDECELQYLFDLERQADSLAHDAAARQGRELPTQWVIYTRAQSPLMAKMRLLFGGGLFDYQHDPNAGNVISVQPIPFPLVVLLCGGLASFQADPDSAPPAAPAPAPSAAVPPPAGALQQDGVQYVVPITDALGEAHDEDTAPWLFPASVVGTRPVRSEKDWVMLPTWSAALLHVAPALPTPHAAQTFSEVADCAYQLEQRTIALATPLTAFDAATVEQLTRTAMALDSARKFLTQLTGPAGPAAPPTSATNGHGTRPHGGSAFQ